MIYAYLQEDCVCMLKKSLYGLKQAPRALYTHLDKYFHKQRFKRGSVDNTLYIKVKQDNLTLIEVYVDDVIFHRNDDRLSEKFSSDIQSESKMSLLGEINFILGL